MSIRLKLMLVGLLFMAIPIMGYQFISDMQQLVQKGQEQALLLEAKAIASVLHDRQELFSKETGLVINQQNSNDLYAQLRGKPIKIDGKIDDWADILQNAKFFGKDHQIFGPPPKSDKDISFWHLLAYDNDFVYALFQISDDQLKFRVKKTLSLDQADYLRIYILNQNGSTDNYILNAKQAGTMSAYQVERNWQTPLTGKHDATFLAHLIPTDVGYNIELRIPLDKIMQSQYIAFAIVDYDPKHPKIISTVNPETAQKLNRILLRSPQVENILAGLDKPNGRIWVVDLYQRVRAVVGSLQSKTEVTEDAGWSDFLFTFLLTQPSYEFKDHPDNIKNLTNKSIKQALQNKANNFIRQSIDKKATILGAVVPIEVKGIIAGAVIVEQTNNQILALENKALLNVMQQISAIFLVATLTMVWFATRLTYRINRLHLETNAATTESGKIKTNTKITVHSKDELGKLAQSISHMLSSLSQHTQYLERMPRTLRHEILNPLSVINMSLDNLSRISNPSPQEAKYIASTQNGINRLAAILHSLTEATNLESALINEEIVDFDLSKLLQEYLDNYKNLHPKINFIINLPQQNLFMSGWPESIAQMLDKILDNAVDFTADNKNISITLNHQNCIYIHNQGQHIAAEIKENIFESMVSKRSDKHQHKPHLGIGLYVARVIAEAHNGKISVNNTNNPQGVEFMICLPTSQQPPKYQKPF